jgi:UDP-N-acetylglucosamine:LPS N-acetylglucosamine transferase
VVQGNAKRVLAIASGGGHWIQLSRMLPAFDGCDLALVTTLASYREQVQHGRFYVVPDANLNTKFSLILMALRIALVVLWERPDVVISTGAAPGYVGLRIGRWLGAKTIWVDSMANADQLSRSGQQAGRIADLWLTQWPQLARPEGPHYVGAVL